MVTEYSLILTWMMLLPAVGAIIILLLPTSKAATVRRTAMAFSLGTLALSLVAASMFDWSAGTGYGTAVQLKTDVVWITSLNVHYFVGVDGISMPLLLLTTVISVLATWASWSIDKHVKGYFALLLFLIAGMIGVFISLDLLLFYVFFEISLFPMYFLIGIWGGPRKEYAAIKFFLYTLFGSVGLLITIIGLYYYSKGLPAYPQGNFDLIKLATDPAITSLFTVGGSAATFAAVAFWLLFIAFAVKVPSVPFHTWLPDAHVEAPTPISMILAAVLLKMGGYGFFRISYPIFPQQAADNWFWIALIGVISIIYGAFCAMAQRDFKKLVAYSSVSHMGYVLLGLAVMTPAGTAGAMFQMIAHGISSAMMFFIVGVLYERAHHRDIPKLGGFWAQMPVYTGWATVGFFASMGLPGLCGFIGELLVLVGTFGAASADSMVMQLTGGTAFTPVIIMGVITALAVVLTAAYLLWTMQRVFMGPPKPEYSHFEQINVREKCILGIFGFAAILFGVAPMILLTPIKTSLDGMLKLITG